MNFEPRQLSECRSPERQRQTLEARQHHSPLPSCPRCLPQQCVTKIKSATYSAWYDITITFTTSIINFSMLTGTVKFFNETKGFGFIKEDESGTEYFVHITGLVDKVRENDKVTFELKEGRKGMNAVSVKQAYA